MDHFSNSYREAREKFHAAATHAGARLHTYQRNDIRGMDGEGLACDVAVVGPGRAEKVAIVIAGTHGVEGYCGSAILSEWLTTRTGDRVFNDIKIVLVHAINPWAFSHKTRTTENNVDLNRNFVPDHLRRKQVNSSYDKLASFLHAPVLDAQSELELWQGYKNYLDENGWQIENEMFQGQCHRPDGLFYAGVQSEWSNETFRQIAREHLESAKSIGFVDWHTGVGMFGEVVYLIFDEKGTPEHDEASRWWGRNNSATFAFTSGTVPRYEGLLNRSLIQELPNARIAGAVVEFGTCDPYALFRADRLDRWLRFEGRDDPQYSELRKDYMQAFTPHDAIWRRFVMKEGSKIIEQLIDGIGSWMPQKEYGH